MGSSQPNGNSVPVSSSGTHGGISDHQSHLSSSPLASMGMNVNLLSLLNSGQLSAVPTSTSSSTGSSPLTKTPSTLKAPPSSLLGSSNSLTAAALDLSSARPSEGKGAFSSDEENY